MTTFRRGQRVVCVDAKVDPGYASFETGHQIFEGQIYTIHRSFIDDDGDPIVWLNEVRRGPRSVRRWGPDAGWRADRFRPLVETETKTDISALTALLNTKAKDLVD